MLGHWFGIFDLTEKDTPDPWEPILELLLTAERDRGEAVVILGGIGLVRRRSKRAKTSG